MASIETSVLLNTIVGSAGNSTFARNKGGNYVKVRKTSANPRTSYQQNIRALMTATSSIWRNYTEEQRQSWADASILFPYQNRFGQTKYYSGFQLYMKFNSVLNVGNLGNIGDAPTPYVFPTFQEFYSIGVNVAQLQIGFAASAADSNVVYYFFASPPQSAGVNMVSPSTYKYLSYLGCTGSDIQDFIGEYTSRLGPPIVGTKIFFKAYMVNALTGQISGTRIFNSVVS